MHLLDVVPDGLLDIAQLAHGLELTPEVLDGLTFRPVLSHFVKTEDLSRQRFAVGLLRTTDYAYCPACLQAQPCHRRLWLCSDITWCTEHGVALRCDCPHCGERLQRGAMDYLDLCPGCHGWLGDIVPVHVDPPHEQRWMTDAWTTLMGWPRNVSTTSDRLALRLLFLLNDREPMFNRARVRERLGDCADLMVLLQHARQTLSQRRTLHLATVFSILMDLDVTMAQFLAMDVPAVFVRSVQDGLEPLQDGLACQAPWCPRYGKPGGLQKTGTSRKQRADGRILHYYLVCSACECQYALDHGALTERTPYIAGYRVLGHPEAPAGLVAQARAAGLTPDQMRRCRAYFAHRGLISGGEAIDPVVLDRVIAAVDAGIPIKTIARWPDWTTEQPFVLFQYHPDVQAHLRRRSHRSRPGRQQSVNHLIEVQAVLTQLMDAGTPATIRTVARVLHVAPETLRGWGCLPAIAAAKKSQQLAHEAHRRSDVQRQVDTYCAQVRCRDRRMGDLFRFLGMSRTVLWRQDPDLMRWIQTRMSHEP